MGEQMVASAAFAVPAIGVYDESMADAATRPKPMQEDRGGGLPRVRRLFFIKNDRIYLCPPGFTSHVDWFRHERWIANGDKEKDDDKFFAHIVMGVCFLDDKSLHCFRDMDFLVDQEMFEKVVDMVTRNLHHIKKLFDLHDDAKVFIGPNGKGKFIGTIKTLLERARRREPEIRAGE